MQSYIACQCGKQIKIPNRSPRRQSFAFFPCVACGTLYSFPHESSPHESLLHESLLHESSPETSSPETSSPRTSSPRTSSPGTSSPGTSSLWIPFPQESFPQETMLRESGTCDENEPKSAFVAFNSEPIGDSLSSLYRSTLCPRGSSSTFEPSGDVLSGDTTQSPSPETSLLRKVIPQVLGGLAALSIAIATIWYVFGRGIGGTGHVSQDVPGIVPQTLLADRLETPNKSISQNQPVKFRSQNKMLPALKSPESVQSHEMITLGTSESIKTLRMLRNDLSNVPEDKKDAMMAAYYSTAKKLSKQLASLRGRSVSRWRKALEDLASEILKDNNTRMVMQNGPIGKLPGINASSENDFVVTVLTIDAWDKPDPSSLWSLNEPWILGEQEVSVQMLPGAWSSGSAMEPTNCLVFGRLTAIDSSNAESSTIKRGTLTLQVHAAMPE